MSKHQNPLAEKYRLRATAHRLRPLEGMEILSRLRPSQCPAFLDSASGPKELSRYSYLAWDPLAVLECREGSSHLRMQDRSFALADSPLLALREVFKAFEIDRSAVPFPFAGGAIGWFGYELGRWIEKLPPSPPDDLHFPEVWLGLYDRMLVFDHEKRETLLILCEEGEKPDSTISQIEEILRRPQPSRHFRALEELRSDQSESEFCRAIEKAKQYIVDGDIYQVNLSQRFETRFTGEPTELYRRLREANPAPFACYLGTPHGEILSSSPERFLKIEGRRIETRPIKGTCPRYGDPERDRALREALLQSEKDRAELTMIIDLERNDLKKICRTGTVVVPRLYGLEEYQTVFHLVATIQGELRPEVAFSDVLQATFPGGSITGAPKIRAMEIISELEKNARSVYTGAIGWIGFDGDADLNIAIRTLQCSKQRAVYRVGGGIVADSDPKKEYEETLHKGRGLMQALMGPE